MDYAMAAYISKIWQDVVRIQIHVQIKRKEYSGKFHLVQYISRKCGKVAEIEMHVVAQDKSFCLRLREFIKDSSHIVAPLEKHVKFAIKACKQYSR
jgi:hypothetical protein